MMEGMVLKLPSFHSQFQFINPSRCISSFSSTLPTSSSPFLRFRNRRFSSPFSVSASASTSRETDSLHLNFLSLGHTTRPDFPILHQVLVLFLFSVFFFGNLADSYVWMINWAIYRLFGCIIDYRYLVSRDCYCTLLALHEVVLLSAGSKWLQACLLGQRCHLSETYCCVESFAELLWVLQFKCSSWHTLLEVDYLDFGRKRELKRCISELKPFVNAVRKQLTSMSGQERKLRLLSMLEKLKRLFLPGMQLKLSI